MRSGKPRGRPPQPERVRIQIKLSLDKTDDADLIAWFQQIPEGYRPKAVIAALRQGGMKTQGDEGAGTEGGEWVEDEDFEAMLDML